jgi:hypothetical protein
MLVVANWNMLEVESAFSVIRNQIHWKSFVESKLLLVKQADDGANAIQPVNPEPCRRRCRFPKWPVRIASSKGGWKCEIRG